MTGNENFRLDLTLRLQRPKEKGLKVPNDFLVLAEEKKKDPEMKSH